MSAGGTLPQWGKADESLVDVIGSAMSLGAGAVLDMTTLDPLNRAIHGCLAAMSLIQSIVDAAPTHTIRERLLRDLPHQFRARIGGGETVG